MAEGLGLCSPLWGSGTAPEDGSKAMPRLHDVKTVVFTLPDSTVISRENTVRFTVVEAARKPCGSRA
jgi:hypothetical protein